MLTKVEDEDDIPPPPLSIVRVNVHTLSGKINPEDQIMMIRSICEDASDSKQSVESLFDNKQDSVVELLIDIHQF